MKLFETKHYVVSLTYEINLSVWEPTIPGVIRAARRVLSSTLLLDMIETDSFFFQERQTISADCRYILDCVGKTWVQGNKISSIKLLRKVFDCSLVDGKNALDEYLA